MKRTMAEDVYENCTENSFSVLGEYLFKSSAKSLKSWGQDQKLLWLSLNEKLLCKNYLQALKIWKKMLVEKALYGTEIEIGAGFITDEDGTITHHISPNGRLWGATYLGKIGEELAVESIKISQIK